MVQKIDEIMNFTKEPNTIFENQLEYLDLKNNRN